MSDDIDAEGGPLARALLHQPGPVVSVELPDGTRAQFTRDGQRVLSGAELRQHFDRGEAAAKVDALRRAIAVAHGGAQGLTAQAAGLGSAMMASPTPLQALADPQGTMDAYRDGRDSTHEAVEGATGGLSPAYGAAGSILSGGILAPEGKLAQGLVGAGLGAIEGGAEDGLSGAVQGAGFGCLGAAMGLGGHALAHEVAPVLTHLAHPAAHAATKGLQNLYRKATAKESALAMAAALRRRTA
jgi:hypothetical protein